MQMEERAQAHCACSALTITEVRHGTRHIQLPSIGSTANRKPWP